MPALHRDRDTSDQRQDYRDQKDDDREISLGTGTILAIFFALALICAAFFGLGYSMGRKSAQTPALQASEPAAPSSNFSSFKPPAGSPAAQPSAVKKTPETTGPPGDPDNEIATTPVSTAGDSASRSNASTRKESAPVATAVPAVREAPRTAEPLSQPQSTPSGQSPASAMPPVNPNGTAMVQVAAVSHQEDADTLIAALKKRGYTVFIRQEPLDKLLHVQLGPFATRKDADTMRQRLLADGYNAIVK